MSTIRSIRCEYVTLFRIAMTPLVWLGLGLAALTGAGSSARAAPDSDSPMEEAMVALRDQDAVLARAAWRLTTANAPLCDEQMPATGLILHAESQYSGAGLQSARAVFGFPAPLAIEATVPDSPAARSGLQAGDGVTVIDSRKVVAEGIGPTSLRDEAETALVRLAPTAPLSVTYVRAGKTAVAEIRPVAACRARFEVVAGKDWLARSDGQIIQVAAGIVAKMRDDEVAVIVAHELAHIVLHHRRRLTAAGVSKGLFAEFGKNGRLNRQAEDEADRLSAVLLRNAGYDPGIGPKFFRDHSGRFGGILRKRTHAAPEARARAMEQEIATIPATAGAVWVPPLIMSRDRPMS